MKRTFERETERTKAEDRTASNWSNIVEMLLYKGVRNYLYDCKSK